MKTKSPRKQRKRLYTSSESQRYKYFSSHLSPDLKKSHNVRSIPVRKGDTVQIIRGALGGFEGKITRINRKRFQVFVEGVNREKVDGTTTLVPIHPSKIMITRLYMADKWRKRILDRKGIRHHVESPNLNKVATEKEQDSIEEVSQ